MRLSDTVTLWLLVVLVVSALTCVAVCVGHNISLASRVLPRLSGVRYWRVVLLKIHRAGQEAIRNQ